jgi:hypothetical protein
LPAAAAAACCLTLCWCVPSHARECLANPSSRALSTSTSSRSAREGEHLRSAFTRAHFTRHTRVTLHVTRHTSHVTRHTSHVTRHTSHVTRHTSHVTRRVQPHKLGFQNMFYYESQHNFSAISGATARLHQKHSPTRWPTLCPSSAPICARTMRRRKRERAVSALLHDVRAVSALLHDVRAVSALLHDVRDLCAIDKCAHEGICTPACGARGGSCSVAATAQMRKARTRSASGTPFDLDSVRYGTASCARIKPTAAGARADMTAAGARAHMTAAGARAHMTARGAQSFT